jgi:hypothetical protein
VQYFERLRLSLHADGSVTVDPLGATLTAGSHFAPADPSAAATVPYYFAQTRHTLDGPFASFWQAHHGSLLFGPPISEMLFDAGSGMFVQYFENARLEFHPGFAGTPYVIEIGLLGRSALQQRGWL